MVMTALLVLASFTISSFSIYVIRGILHKSLIDIPNERSSHTQPTPRGGGIGIIIAFALTSAIAAYFSSPTPAFIPLWLTLIPLAVIGILDDIYTLPSAPRYFVQLTTAGIATYFFNAFPQPWLTSWGILGQAIAILLTVVGFTALINFYNFMDGLDGLIAGCTAIQLGFLALYLNQPIFWLLVASILGFLYWNWSPAKIFMGDVGSTVLGASIAISLLNHPDRAVQAWSALAITFPIIGDAIYTLFRRLAKQENIFKAHRSHLYQRLHQSGWSHSQVSLTYMGFTFLIAVAIALYGSTGAWMSLVASMIALILLERYLQGRQGTAQTHPD
jgi:Fuc2NAc and GlcNAc transferase